MLALLLEAALRSFALGALVWLGQRLFRVRDPRAHMTAWTIVLVASLTMPLAMQRVTFPLPTLPVAPQVEAVIGVLPRPAPALGPAEAVSRLPHAAEALPPTPATAPAVTEARVGADAFPPPAEGHSARWPDWLSIATDAYALVAGILLLRLLTGIALSWRIARAALPILEPWAAGWNVRVSELVGVPVTFGSAILLPTECTNWSAAKREAVLAHERSHVVRGDCYVLLIAALNRAVFWFSPFAWWQFKCLSELAETISDDAAIAAVADHRSYARILLDLAGDVRYVPAGLAMARASTMRRRIERILTAPVISPQAGWRKQIMIALALAPVAGLCAGAVFRAAAPPSIVASGRLPHASALSADSSSDDPRQPDQTARVDQQLQNSHMGYYRLDRNLILAITWQGDDVFAQVTGERKLQIFPAADGEFVYDAGASRVSFSPAGDGHAGESILHTNDDVRHAVKIADVPQSNELAVEVAEDVLDRYVGWYELGSFRALAVTREQTTCSRR